MATLYLIGMGNRTWDSSNTTIWSTSSGGSSSGTYPVNGDTIIWDSNSGSGVISLAINISLASFTSNTSSDPKLRILLASSVIGTPRTLTVTSIPSISYIDFRDIAAAGAANWNLSAITGGSGDCGGNSGITFTTAVPQYFKHLGGGSVNWSNAAKWFSDAAMTIAGRVPLPQDDPLHTANSYNAPTTLNVDVPRIGRSLNMEGVTQAVGMTLANNIECYGSYVLGSNITPSGNFSTLLFGRSSFNLNLYGKTFYSLNQYAYGGSYLIQSNLVSTTSIYVWNGIFDLNNYNLTALNFANQGNSTAMIIYFRSGTISLSKNTSTILSVPTNFYAGNSTIIFSPISGSDNIIITGNGQTFNKVQFSGTHSGNFDISGSNTFAELIIDPGRKGRITNGTTQTITKSLKGGSGNTLATLTSTTPGSTYTINAPNGLTSSFLDISYANVTGGMTANYSRNRIGNTGILFNSQAGIHKPKRGFINNRVNDLSSLKGTGPTQGLIAAYTMQPKGGVLVDTSGNGYNGTLSGGVVNTKNGLSFNGLASKVTCSTVPLTGDLTFCGRYRLKTSGGGTIGRILDSVAVNLFFINDQLILSRNGNLNFVNSATLQYNKWYNFLVTSTSTGITNFYINGVLNGVINQSSIISGSPTTMLIGNNPSANRGLDGELQDLRIYNRILSLQEIKAYHNSFVKPYIVDDMTDYSIGQTI